MNFVADLHIHSHYSRATSKNLTPEHIDYWAGIKGIGVVGSGDFTHPAWTRELREKLVPAEPGLFALKSEHRLAGHESSPAGAPRFMLTAEISCICKFDGRVRKVHHVLCAPDFETVEKIQDSLGRIGNITSDGRPILGLDSRDLLELVLEASPDIFFIPAHIWTPWFSSLGSKSGFDSIEECFRDLSSHIHAVETGLSSDPPMNWMCSFLDGYTLVSNSDAHSPEKLGREANLLDTELSYHHIVDAMARGRDGGFLGTVEFFPQEGKYHFDGHRKCSVRWDPVETIQHGAICPECGKPVTEGVLSRVAQLADRDDVEARPERIPFHSLVPLKEILAELLGVGPNTKRVDEAYRSLIRKGGSEFSILREADLGSCTKMADDLFAEAIRRMRARQVVVDEGYDGEYGRVRVFAEGEKPTSRTQDLLFADITKSVPPAPLAMVEFDLSALQSLKETVTKEAHGASPPEQHGTSLARDPDGLLEGLNAIQRDAVVHEGGPALVLAGPGTGKTKTLTTRIAYLITEQGIAPETMLALTFTNKAAAEMRSRLRSLVGSRKSEPQVATFHAFGLSILHEQWRETGRHASFSIIGEEEKIALLRELPQVGDNASLRERAALAMRISQHKHRVAADEPIEDDETTALVASYEDLLREMNAFDLDDFVCLPIALWRSNPGLLRQYQDRYRFVFVDEYQDVNAAQYRLLRMLAPAADANLYVIGDPNQAIYGFRGAQVRYIHDFKNDYPETVTYRLRTSYRCSDTILTASGQLLRTQAEEHTEGADEGINVRTIELPSDRSEAEFVARTIEQMVGGLQFFSIDSAVTKGDGASGIESLSDFAILCRVRRQMSLVERALLDHHIPYQRIDTRPPFSGGAARVLIDLLKYHRNPSNRIVALKLAEHGVSPRPTQTGAAAHTDFGPVRAALEKLRDDYGISDTTDGSDADSDVVDLLRFADGFSGDYDAFLRAIDLGSGLDRYVRESEKVTLMTLHAAKGLEFESVFIVGCEDGLIPYTLFRGDETDIEEERRLLYVAMTRAKRYLYLTHAAHRTLFGKTYRNARSPFLEDLEQSLIDRLHPEEYRKRSVTEQQLPLFDGS